MLAALSGIGHWLLLNGPPVTVHVLNFLLVNSVTYLGVLLFLQSWNKCEYMVRLFRCWTC
jgi:hypothetical protein